MGFYNLLLTFALVICILMGISSTPTTIADDIFVHRSSAVSVDDLKVIPFIMVVIGRTGSSFFCRRIHSHPCAYCFQEDPCHEMAELVAMRKAEDSIEPSKFWFKHEDPKRNSISQLWTNFQQIHTGEAHTCPTGNKLVLGAKCGADRDLQLDDKWIEEGREAKFESVISSVKGTHVIYLYRNNSLDWWSAIGHAKGSDTHAVHVDAKNMVKQLKDKMAWDARIGKELKDLTTKYNHPYMTVMYEDLCTKRNSIMGDVYRFLGLTNQTQIDMANAVPEKQVKKHQRKHKDMYKNYDEVVHALREGGLEAFLEDEECTTSHGAHHSR